MEPDYSNLTDAELYEELEQVVQALCEADDRVNTIARQLAADCRDTAAAIEEWSDADPDC
jgi:hypothetical protein